MISSLIIPSPIQHLPIPIYSDYGVDLWVKREDLIHDSISGNKWRKLKYNLLQARQEGKRRLVTFGGAFSNHIYAVAAAGHALGWDTLGFIRGEQTDPLNPTLAFARSMGMELRFLSRSEYRDHKRVIAESGIDMEQYYVLPEGGTNELALPGCAEIGLEIKEQFEKVPDYIAVCCGTGGTIAGLIEGMEDESQIMGFSVLKGNFHQPIIQDLLRASAIKKKRKESASWNRWSINTDYHFGGYARHKQELIDFINKYKAQFQLPLDPIYTAKLFWGLEDLVKKQYFKPETTILAIHTGGLQGIQGFNQRFGHLIH